MSNFKRIVQVMGGAWKKYPVKHDKSKGRILAALVNKACPSCKTGKLVKRTGYFGDFYGCTNFPNCKMTIKIGRQYYSHKISQKNN